jgi:hypothetical protein
MSTLTKGTRSLTAITCQRQREQDASNSAEVSYMRYMNDKIKIFKLTRIWLIQVGSVKRS